MAIIADPGTFFVFADAFFVCVVQVPSAYRAECVAIQGLGLICFLCCLHRLASNNFFN